MPRRLRVLPDDTARPLLDALAGATRSINIRMFLFADPELLAAVQAAQKRGVKVRVMLNPQRRDGSSDNEDTRRALLAAGVEVRDSSPAFAVTHQKSMLIDGRAGYIESLNWETRDLTETRDCAVVTTDALEVSEMVLQPDKLVEGVGGLRIMRDVGAKVHRLKHLKLHGKMLLADESRAVIGSINLAPGSFDQRRELAIETEAPEVIARLKEVTRHDWDNSSMLDLSDEGVLADLDKHHGKHAGAKQLALKGGGKKK